MQRRQQSTKENHEGGSGYIKGIDAKKNASESSNLYRKLLIITRGGKTAGTPTLQPTQMSRFGHLGSHLNAY